ncbi:MmcQ/YjbR family DNA-binding protein [Kitasatospora sp. NBC_00374]|uniref:MmcQ/YjbR family DNA-binding protein n=1 Tax=Kitasatospora sp. NBC_00374 TaxID=2975964 RepID=UPI00325308CE
MSATAPERLRALCLALPECEERLSHGEPAWFAGGKRMFATLADHHHDNRSACWTAAPPGLQEHLVAADPDHFFRPPYVGHRGWLGIYLDVDVDWPHLADLVTAAYLLVAPARLRAAASAR